MSETKLISRQVEDLDTRLDQIDTKQDALVSGENIKTINGVSLLGSGDISVIPGSGETNTASNLGAGIPIYDSKVGVDLRFRTLVPGTGITITGTAGGVNTITNSSPGEITTASNIGTGDFGVYDSKSGSNLRFRNLIAGSNVTLTRSGANITITAANAVGEVNTASNLGGGVPVYDSKTGTDLRFRSLVAGSGISISSVPGGATTIASTVTPGETNTGANVGTGTGTVYASKSGTTLNFKTLKAGTNITITNGASDITISAAASAGEANTASNLGGEGLYASKSGVNLNFKGLAAGQGIALSSGTSLVTIRSVYVQSTDPGAVGAGVIWVTP